MQAKELKAGMKVVSGKVVWTVAKVTRNNGMTYAIGTDAKGERFALVKKDGWTIATQS